jgi:hypothetical protein
MLRVLRRIERLEEIMMPLPLGPPEVINVQFVDSERKVVDTLVIQTAPVLPIGRRWRAARGFLRLKGRA